jgi:hypothetical protein
VYNNKQFYSQNFIQSDSSVRGPIFYDSNDTGYYADPNSTSRFIYLNVTTGLAIGTTVGTYAGNFNVYNGIYTAATFVGGWGAYGAVIQLQTDGAGTQDGPRLWYHKGGAKYWSAGIEPAGSNGYGIWEDGSNGGWGTERFRIDPGGNVVSYVSHYSPIYYDGNDSAYYCDPNSTCRTNVEWANQFRSQDNWWLDSAGNERMLWVYNSHNYYKTNDMHVFRRMNNTDLAYIASDGNIWMGTYRDWLSTQVRSGIFYDHNDTGYYCDPNNTSRFVRTNINTGEWNYSSEGWIRYVYGYGSGTIQRGGSTGQWTFEFQNHNDGGTRWLMAHAGDFYASGNITAYWSDKRLKKNIEKISDWKKILAGINGYRFQWNDIGKRMLSKEDDEIDVGLIAQEVQAVYPHGAAIQMLQYKTQNPDGTLEPKDDINYDPENPYLTVREDKLIPVLVEALKAHDAEIEELKEKIRKLENILSFMN